MWANRLINFASGTKSHTNKYNSVIQVWKVLKPLKIRKLELTKVFKNCCKETSYVLLINLVQNIGRKMLEIQNSMSNMSLEFYWSHIWFIFTNWVVLDSFYNVQNLSEQFILKIAWNSYENMQKRTKGKIAKRLINFVRRTKSHTDKYNSVIWVLNFQMTQIP